MRILGIDPGSRIMGYAVLSMDNCQHNPKLLTSGIIKLTHKDFPKKLEEIFIQINNIIQRYTPTTLVLEEIFFFKGIQSTLKLGYARAIPILCSSLNKIQYIEYTAKQIKQVVCGYGNASKEQIRSLVQSTFSNISAVEYYDETDAIAIAFCHCLHLRFILQQEQCA